MQQDDSAVVITQLLGRIASEDSHVFCAGAPYGNSTRWVFDVDHDTLKAGNFVFQLRSWNNNKGVFAPVVSISFTPLSKECWHAQPFIQQPKLPNLCIQAGVRADRIKYRVAIDLVHSTSR